jgi:hypothetical protein
MQHTAGARAVRYGLCLALITLGHELRVLELSLNRFFFPLWQILLPIRNAKTLLSSSPPRSIGKGDLYTCTYVSLPDGAGRTRVVNDRIRQMLVWSSIRCRDVSIAPVQAGLGQASFWGTKVMYH